MADDLTTGFSFDDGLDDDIPVVSGGKKQLLQGGRLVVGEEDRKKAPSGSSASSVKPEPKPKPEPNRPPLSSPNLVEKKKTKNRRRSKKKSAADGFSSDQLTVKIADLQPFGQKESQPRQSRQPDKPTSSDQQPPKKDGSEQKKPVVPKTNLESDVEKATGFNLTDEDLRPRFEVAAEAYLKGLRDELETRSRFSMSVGSGGLGMTDDQARQALEPLKRKKQDSQLAQRTRAEQEKRKFVSDRVDRQLKDGDRQVSRNRSDLDRRFALLTGKGQPSKPVFPSEGQFSPARMPTRPPEPKVVKVRSSSPGEDQNRHQDAAVAETFRDLFGDDQNAPPATKSPPPKNLPLVGDEDTGLTGQLSKPVISERGSSPAVSAGQISVGVEDRPVFESRSGGNVPVGSAGRLGRKLVVSDVQSVRRRLTGPVEELGTMTLQDFRRLSRNPEEATRRIRDKVDLLSDQSFADRTTGVKAWRKSPVNRLYLGILQRSLEGVPVDEALKKAAEADGESLTREEFNSLMAVNRDLRF